MSPRRILKTSQEATLELFTDFLKNHPFYDCQTKLDYSLSLTG